MASRYLDALERHWRAQRISTDAPMDETVERFKEKLEKARRELTGEVRDAVTAGMERGLKELKAQIPANLARVDPGWKQEVAFIRRYRQKASAEDLARP